MYEKSSISVVNPTWQEPFGRTAMESASRGCAVLHQKVVDCQKHLKTILY